MENVGIDQRAQMINELLQGLECVKQFQRQINDKNALLLCDNDDQKHNYSSLVQKMMSTFDKTITRANQINPSIPNNNSLGPLSDNSRPDTRPSKRRKMMTKWTKNVQISPDVIVNGLEGPLDDGFSWRKYGQKGIFKARFPRGYYRCTHRYTKNCSATKQVQKSDDDPSIYQVMYKGEHTCYPRPNPNTNQAQLIPNVAHQPNSQPTAQEIFVGLSPEGGIEIGPDEIDNKAHIFRCFSFKSALLEADPLENYILGSPTASDSSYFPTSSYEVSAPSVELGVHTPEFDNNDSNSGQNSVSNSPTVDDFEFCLSQWLDLDLELF